MPEGTPDDAPGPGADRGAANDSRRGPAIFLIVVIVLAGLCWLLVQKLAEISRIQDCVMQGRKNCAPIDPDSPK